METREALLREAEHAFASRGYGATSMDEIASKVGMTKAAIYYHFPSKRALLTELLDESLESARAALEADAPLGLRLQAYADVFHDQLEPLTAVATAQSTRRGGDLEAVQIAGNAMRRGVALIEEALSSEVGAARARLLAPIFSTLVHGVHMMAQHDPLLDRDALVAEGIRIFVRGMAEDKA